MDRTFDVVARRFEPLSSAQAAVAPRRIRVLRVIDNHHARISHVHTKDVRKAVVDRIDRSRESFLDAVIKGAFTVPGDGSLDFEAIVKRLAGYGYEGWFVVEAEQDPVKNPPLKMAEIGHAELLRVMDAAGYEVVR